MASTALLAYHSIFPGPCDKCETKSMLPISQSLPLKFLVHTLEWRNSLALGLVKCVADDLAVGQIDLAVRLLLERQGVLHPVDVVTVGVVFTGVGTTRLLAVGGRGGGLGTADRQYIIKKSIAPLLLTRRSAGSSAPESRRGQSSRSCCGP